MAEGNYPNGDQTSDKYKVMRPVCLNVLLIGGTQSGKGAIIQTLIDPTCSVDERAFSDTKESKATDLVVFNKIDDECYQVNIIDTPGLKECMRDGESLSDELISLQNQLLVLKVYHLNVVCFVSRADKKLHDARVFNQLMSMLGPKFSKISMMLLTHCSEVSENELDRFEAEITQNSKTNSIIKYCLLGIRRSSADHKHEVVANPVDLGNTIASNKDRLKRTRAMNTDLLDAWINTAGDSLSTNEFRPCTMTKLAEENVGENTSTCLSRKTQEQSQDGSLHGAANCLKTQLDDTDENASLLGNVNFSNQDMTRKELLVCAH
jgi:hypothetical protein